MRAICYFFRSRRRRDQNITFPFKFCVISLKCGLQLCIMWFELVGSWEWFSRPMMWSTIAGFSKTGTATFHDPWFNKVFLLYSQILSCHNHNAWTHNHNAQGLNLGKCFITLWILQLLNFSFFILLSMWSFYLHGHMFFFEQLKIEFL